MARRIQRSPRDRIESSRSWRTVPRPTDWNARVTAVIARDQSCRWQISAIPGDLCGSVERLEVDHIGDPRDHSLPNLQALCRRHHAIKTGRQAAAAREAKRIPRNRPAERHPGLIE